MYTLDAGAIAPSLAREPEAPYNANPPDLPPLAISPDTHVTKTLSPGQPGTLGWSRIHGDELVCVRYRESADGVHRYTTIELVVDERINRRPRPSPLVSVSVDFNDGETRQRVSAAGGVWRNKQKIWVIRESAAQALKLPYRPLQRSRYSAAEK